MLHDPHSRTDLSLAVPISNSLTFALTLLAGYLLGEELGSSSKWGHTRRGRDVMCSGGL